MSKCANGFCVIVVCLTVEVFVVLVVLVAVLVLADQGALLQVVSPERNE